MKKLTNVIAKYNAKLAIKVYRHPRTFWLAAALKYPLRVLSIFVSIGFSFYYWQRGSDITQTLNNAKMLVAVVATVLYWWMDAHYFHKDLKRARESFVLRQARRRELKLP